MFEKKTVLVLGAGASAPYGFPSGEGLVREIVAGLETGSGMFECVRQCYDRGLSEEFARRLIRSGTASVDAFLEKQEDAEFLDLGKSCIAAALLPKENESRLFEEDEQNWYRKLFGLLVEDAPFDNFDANNLSIITFNYDRSLEHFLMTALHNLHRGKSIGECREKLRAIKIIHVYGKLGPLPWEEQLQASGESFPCEPVPYGEQALQEDHGETLFAQRHLLGVAARNIQIISESQDETEILKEAVHLLMESSKVFLLGFGFHPTNLRRLKPERLKRQQMKCTTHGLPADRHRLLNRYQGLTDPIDRSRAFQAPSGWYDGKIHDFIQKVGLM